MLMNNTQSNFKNLNRIWPVVIISLALVCVITFPFAFNLTYSLPGAKADRTLTYKTGSLTWDSKTKVNSDGTAVLSMFKSNYDNTVDSSNGDKVVAPGTANTENIRLLNTANNSISYTAVLYRLDSTSVPIQADLSDDNAQETDNYSLPSGVNKSDVIKAVAGTSSASTVNMLSVNWSWDFSGANNVNSDASNGAANSTTKQTSDEIDTAFGNASEADVVEYGVYVVVTDNYDKDSSKDSSGNASGKKIVPKTGDNSILMIIFIIVVIALILAIIFAILNRKKRREYDEGRHSNGKGPRQ